MKYKNPPFQFSILCLFCITLLARGAEPNPRILLLQADATPTIQTTTEASALNISRIGALVLPSLSLDEANVADVIHLLMVRSREIDPQKIGISFLVDNDVRSSTSRINLDCTNVTFADAIRYLALLARLNVSVVDDAVRLRQSYGDGPKILARKPSPRIARLSAFVFPFMECTNVTLEEAVDFIRFECREINPTRESVTIIIDPDLIGDRIPKITLDVRNVTMVKALRFVSELANVDAICIGDAYYLRPKGK
jgi:hypothetical protein